MLLRLLLLIWDQRSYYLALNTTAFVFALLAARAVFRSRQRRWLWWLVPLTVGVGIEPLVRALRLVIEVCSNSPRLPHWQVTLEHDAFFVGQAFLIGGTFLLWRTLRSEAEASRLAERAAPDEGAWPPPVPPVK